jgi:hypothetical protein
MKKLLLALSTMILISCGGGGGSDTPSNQIQIVNMPLPSLTSIRSDFSDRPNAGTVVDPIIIGPNYFSNSTEWQSGVCSISTGTKLVWPQANFYNTSKPGELFWNLDVNNEGSYDNDGCNTGPPNRSEQVNAKHFFLEHDTSFVKMKIRQTKTDNCRKIPYMGLASFDSKAISGSYGDKIHVSWDDEFNFSTNPKHLHFHYLDVLFEDAHGNRKMAMVYLFAPLSGWSDTDEFSMNWSWRAEGSMYYPGAKINAIYPSSYNTKKNVSTVGIPLITVPGKYKFDIDLDDVIRTTFPNDLNGSLHIIGVEISIEQDYAWSQNPEDEEMFMESKITNLKAYKVK